MKERYIECLEEMLISHGCHIYELPTSLNPSIKRICNELNIHIYDAPSAFESGHLYLGFTAAITYALNKVIVIHTYDFNNVLHLEFAIWHEFGHLMNDDHDSESDADDFAIKQLTQVYGEVKSDVTYRNWLFNEYHVDTATGSHDEMKDKDKPKYGFRLDRITSYLVNNH